MEPSTEEHTIAIVEFNEFSQYFKKTVSVLLLEENGAYIPALNTAVEDKETQECIRKFLSDPQVATLSIQRSIIKGMLFTFLSSQACSKLRYLPCGGNTRNSLRKLFSFQSPFETLKLECQSEYINAGIDCWTSKVHGLFTSNLQLCIISYRKVGLFHMLIHFNQFTRQHPHRYLQTGSPVWASGRGRVADTQHVFNLEVHAARCNKQWVQTLCLNSPEVSSAKLTVVYFWFTRVFASLISTWKHLTLAEAKTQA